MNIINYFGKVLTVFLILLLSCTNKSIESENQPPEVPSTPIPNDGATDQETSLTLSWACEDPEGSQITYDVYLGSNANPPIVSSAQDDNSYVITDLLFETNYFWKIVARDDGGRTTSSPIWEFTTRQSGNQPPNIPTNPYPDSGATEVEINLTLTWQCTDPDSDPLTYDIRFGTSSPPTTVSINQSQSTYDPGQLQPEEQYYWQIIARDDQDSTDGPTWSFVTRSVVPDTTDTVTDIDGNVYQTIKIGEQWWITSNLKVTHYNNGDPIPHVTDAGAWGGLTTGAYCAYNNDVNNIETYGMLYNWYAVDDPREIAPAGWHVPTDYDWWVLVDYLGGAAVAGGSLKEAGTTHWNPPNEGATNQSGFSALPGGYRDGGGGFYSLRDYATFWASTAGYGDDAWVRHLSYNGPQVGRNYLGNQLGFSVRCVRY
jgi:uncharacterized protein (TIGR02145 family)